MQPAVDTNRPCPSPCPQPSQFAASVWPSTALLCVILIACGGGGTDAAGTVAATPAPSPAPAAGVAGVACSVVGSGSQLLAYTHMLSSVSETLPYSYAWSCSSTARSLVGNGVPNHAVTGGRFATRISAQPIVQSMPFTPSYLGGSGTALKDPGYAINSVKFDPGTAGTCASSATSHAGGCNDAGGTDPWRMEALPGTVSPWQFDFGTDSSNAHVQPNGQYHYHGMPVDLIPKLNTAASTSMSLVGWAKDGYPIYARYGYAVAGDAKSALRAMTGSYRVKATPDAGRPSTAFFAMGHFQQDWEYASGSGDLDECNGRTGVTPEYPGGIYHYYVTDSYPFIQRCVKGQL